MRRALRARWGRILAVWVGLGALIVLITGFLVGCDTAYCAEWEDLGVVHKTLIAEAGGEEDRILAMQAVANVIRNRSMRRNLTPDEVVMQRLQFSCWNGGAGRVDAFTRKNRAVWDDALTAWQLSGVEDVTDGADLYHADYVKPRWDWSKTVRTVKIGQHIFYREVR